MATNQSYAIATNINISVTTQVHAKKNCKMRSVKEMVLFSTTKFSNSLGIATMK